MNKLKKKMKNIFEGAKFGDRFLLSDNSVAIYWKKIGYFTLDEDGDSLITHLLITPTYQLECKKNGKLLTGDTTNDNVIGIPKKYDVVSKEPIDIEYLASIADGYCTDVWHNKPLDKNGDATYEWKDIDNAFRAGYIKGKKNEY